MINWWTNIGNSIALSTINTLKWICLFVCIGSVIFYACGIKKASRWSIVSFVIFFISQCCKSGLK